MSLNDYDSFLDSKRKLRREGEKMRRERLNSTISQLAEEIPWLKHSDRRPDKASILKLTVNYLKLQFGIKKKKLGVILPDFLKDSVSESFLEKAADGNLLIVSDDGTIVYMSETVSTHLGYSQIDVLGSHINKILHKEDQDVFQLQFTTNNTTQYTTKSYPPQSFTYIPVCSSRKVKKSFFVRMLNCHKQNGSQPFYEEMQIIGHIHHNIQDKKRLRSVLNENWLVAVCRPVKNQDLLCMRQADEASKQEWVSQHSLDGKLWYQDHRTALVLGIMPSDDIGKSVYDLVYKEDLKDIACSHMKLMTDEEIPSTVFRIQSQNGLGPVKYIKARSIIVKDAWTKKHLFIVSLNQVVEKDEGDILLKDQQKRSRALIAATKRLTSQDQSGDATTPAQDQDCQISNLEIRPYKVTTIKSTSTSRLEKNEQPSQSDLHNDGERSKSAKSCSQFISREMRSKNNSVPLLKSLLTSFKGEESIGGIETQNNSYRVGCDKLQNVYESEVKNCAQCVLCSENRILSSECVVHKVPNHVRPCHNRDHTCVPQDLYDLEPLTELNIKLHSKEAENQNVTKESSVWDKKYFLSQVSKFFPVNSSSSVLDVHGEGKGNKRKESCDNCDRNVHVQSPNGDQTIPEFAPLCSLHFGKGNCEARESCCKRPSLPSVVDNLPVLSTLLFNRGDDSCQGNCTSADGIDTRICQIQNCEENACSKGCERIQSPTVSSQEKVIQDEVLTQMEVGFCRQLQAKYKGLNQNLSSQEKELSLLQKCIKDNVQHNDSHLIQKLNLLQNEVEEQCSILHGLEDRTKEKLATALQKI